MSLASEPHQHATFDAGLPTLPIPSVASTLRKYERSLEPLLNHSELNEARALLAAFGASETAATLQKRLEALRAQCDARARGSWMSDIWLKHAYLKWREPSFVNVNWSMILRPHPFGARVDAAARAAHLVRRLVIFRRFVERNEIPLQGSGKQQQRLCLDQFTRVFSTTRIPLKTCDELRVVSAAHAPDAPRHIVVFCRDHMYVVDVCVPGTLDPLPAADIHAQLRAALDDAHKRTDPAVPVGLHTTANRDDAARTRSALIDAGNAAALDTVERALFCVSFDDSEPLDEGEIGMLTHCNVDGRNRWYDKALSLVLFANGAAGLNGEHSPQDAPVPGAAIDYALMGETIDEYRALLASAATAAKAPPTPGAAKVAARRLAWATPPSLRTALEQHRQRASALAGNLDMHLLCFESFGSAALKTLHISPDSFVQMAFQLAFYRLHGRVCATYETVAMRRFRFGRTECGRSCTPESLAFVACMDNAHSTHDERRARLLLALDAHRRYNAEAAAGNGVDRHLLGLRCMVQPNEPTPALFTHVSYERSTDFQVSTSNVSMGACWLALFAPVTEHGYGMPYTIRENAIFVHVTTWNSSHFTPPASTFAMALGGAFRNLYALLSAPTPKL